MCTLTWTHRVASGEASSGTRSDPRGYALFFNRDELRTRGAELPPSVAQTGDVRYLAPTDSDAGGTWIAVNEFGVTIALLNGYIVSKGPARDGWTSRGELVRSLADVRSADDAWRRLTPRALARFRPAVVVVVADRPPALYVRWDGRSVEIDPLGERRLPVTSSSFEQSQVQRERVALYRNMIDGAAPTPEVLRAYQSHVTDDGPTAFTPTMSRPDAATRSQCQIAVGPDRVSLTYVPGPPHTTAPELPLSLERRVPSH